MCRRNLWEHLDTRVEISRAWCLSSAKRFVFMVTCNEISRRDLRKYLDEIYRNILATFMGIFRQDLRRQEMHGNIWARMSRRDLSSAIATFYGLCAGLVFEDKTVSEKYRRGGVILFFLRVVLVLFVGSASQKLCGICRYSSYLLRTGDGRDRISNDNW